MWPFKRQQSNDDKVPAEVKQYYDSEHRERVGLAWLIAFLSLILTVVVIAGLFFGGRWAYRKIAHKSPEPTTTQEGTGLEQPPTSSPNPTVPSTPNDLQPAAPSQNQNNSSSSSSSSSTPTTGTKNQPAQVTNTGPGDTIAIFIGITALAAVSHSVYLRRKLSAN